MSKGCTIIENIQGANRVPPEIKAIFEDNSGNPSKVRKPPPLEDQLLAEDNKDGPEPQNDTNKTPRPK